MQALVDAAAGRFGRLDVAVNSAGTEGRAGHVVERTSQTYASVFHANVLGTILAMKHEIRVMLPQGSGSIINILSAWIAVVLSELQCMPQVGTRLKA